VKVPEANGLGARDAAKAVGAVGLVPLIEGSGRLVRQVPAAGTAVPKGSSVRLVFEPAS
jgi:beta-lactam-binding protein with PASTA domain